MKNNRDFHKQVRVVYRACRKLYGVEKTQDECLRVFKVVFPEMYQARQAKEMDIHISEEGMKRLDAIFTSWHIVKDSELDKLCFTVLGESGKWRSKVAFLQFCEDITPVAMRIRKLSPRECYRLQGVSEKDIDTLLASGISKSAHYKLAGNSITSGGNYQDSQGNWDGPLFNIFRTMFIDTEQPKVAGTQLTLF